MILISRQAIGEIRPGDGLGGSIEVVLRRLIALKSKAQADEKPEHSQLYVSILKGLRGTFQIIQSTLNPAPLETQLLDVRRGFATTSKA